MKRILYLSGSVNLWGARRSLLNLLENIDKKRFSPLVACPKEGPLTAKCESLVIPVEVVNLPLWRKAKNFWKIPAVIFTLVNLIKKREIDLIHCNSHWVTPYGVIAGKFAKVPVISHIRDIIEESKVRKYLLNGANKIITISNTQQRIFYPAIKDEGKLMTIYNGIDTDFFSFQGEEEVMNFRKELGAGKDAPVVGCVGQISSLKGQQYLLEAAPQILTEFPEAKFIFCGEVRRERDEGLVESLVGKFGLEKNVSLLGWRDDLPLIYSAMDVLVFPTLKEAFGRVAAEALSCGVPVVASRVGGVPEIVKDGQTGILVEPENPGQIAEATISLLKNPERRKEIGGKGSKIMKENFSLSKHVREVQEVYNKLLMVDSR